LEIGGVLTFPSFHAASAALYIWAFWPLVWLRPAVVVWNLTMIAATPLGGGHYLVDVLASIVVTILAIAAAQMVSALLPLVPRGFTGWDRQRGSRIPEQVLHQS
jgi:membrane-associated phospholipid phosphatase